MPGLVQYVVAHPTRGLLYVACHLDFHPGGRWAALSMERQDELQVFAVQPTRFDDAPVFTTTTLRPTAPSGLRTHPDQLCSAIHFNARGDRLYIANRHDPSVYGPTGQPCERGGNNLAVYAFDERGGHAELLQHVATDSVHVRTLPHRGRWPAGARTGP